MKLKRLLSYLWKVPLCAGMFFLGVMLGGMVASSLGLQAPALPEGTDQATLGTYLLLVSMVLPLPLAFVSRGIRGRWFARWLILSSLIWIVYAVSTALEASIFAPSDASVYTVVMLLVASLLCGAAMAFLFSSKERGAGFWSDLKGFFAPRPLREWGWRLLLACLAYASIYLVFGLLVVPLTAEYYRQGQFELAAPTWGQILPILFVRSLLFLLVCLPVLVTWQGRDGSLTLSLGSTLFVLGGLMYMIQAYWLPWTMRVFHGLEILADSFVYAWILTVLLPRRKDSLSRLNPTSGIAKEAVC
jgi:hypothetical protein